MIDEQYQEFTIGEYIEMRFFEGEVGREFESYKDSIIEYISRFEECQMSDEELAQLDPQELISTSYWIMSDYAKGQI